MGITFTAEIILPQIEIPCLREHLRRLFMVKHGEMTEPLRSGSKELDIWHPDRDRLVAAELTTQELWTLWRQPHDSPWELTGGVCWTKGSVDPYWPIRIRVGEQGKWWYGNSAADRWTWQEAVRKEQLHLDFGAYPEGYARAAKANATAGGLPLMDLAMPFGCDVRQGAWLVALNGWAVKWNVTWGAWLEVTKDGEG